MAKTYKCEGCGGHLLFNPENQNLKCEYCGAESAVGTSGGVLRLKEAYSPSISYEEYKDAKHVYECESCNTKIATCADEPVTRCVSCGYNKLVEVQADGVHPMTIIPFEIPRASAGEIFKKWIKSRKFAPNNLKKMAKLQKISGLYAPVYSFDLQSCTSYSAEGVDVIKNREGKVVKKRRHNISDLEYRTFEDYIVTGTNSVESSVFKKMGGFNLSNARVYESDYMLGFCGVGTDKTLHEAYQVMTDEVAREEYSRIKSDLNRRYDEVNWFKASTSVSNVFNCYYYAPIWANHYKYKNKDYHCYINGQTGKVTGKSPKSVWKILGLIAGILAGIGLIAFLVMKGR